MSFPALIEELDDAVVSRHRRTACRILHRITDVFVAGSESYSDNQIELFDDVFVRVAAMIELSARTALANRLAKVPRAPSMISRILASDDAIDVAGPVLEQSRGSTMKPWWRPRAPKANSICSPSRGAIALDEAVTDVLVERGDKPVVLIDRHQSGGAIFRQRLQDPGQTVGRRRRTHHLRRLAARYSPPAFIAASGQGIARRPGQAGGRESVDGGSRSSTPSPKPRP